METSEFAVELRKKEKKDKFMENSYAMFQIREAVGRLQMLFKISKEFHKKNPVLGSLFNKAAGLKRKNFIQKRLQHSCSPVKLGKFFRTPFSIEHLWWLLLKSRKFLIFSTFSYD